MVEIGGEKMKPQKRCPIDECRHRMKFNKQENRFGCTHCGYPNFKEVARWKEHRASLAPLPIKKLMRNVMTLVKGGRKIDG